jgi:hypothetical protein
MTSRADVVAVVKSWEGAKQGSATQHKIIDIFNSKVGGMSYTAAWCAATASAAAIKAGAADYYPLSASCGAIINGAKKMGIWVESDSFVPSIGDWVIYDWADGSNYASYDNREGHDHIGTVVAVGNGTFDVVEGNMGRPPRVGRRPMKVNGRYIRGFVHPKLDTVEAKWIQAKDGRWWYRHADGSYTTNGWEKIDGKWYYFDAKGWMVTGWVKWKGKWCYCEGSGACAYSKCLCIKGRWYAFDHNGYMVEGMVWVEDSGALKL